MQDVRVAVMILVAAVAVASGTSIAHAGGTNVESVKFIQYLDENTALEEVRNGNLDMYYYRISPDRIEDSQSREGLKVYDSTGGSYSILVNPAESRDGYNPFFHRDVRFALNYLIDRKLIVNELMGGYGVPMISNYGPLDPEYMTILGQLEEFQFRYNPKLAGQMISDALVADGAERVGGIWTFEEKPVTVTVFIRSDDPVRKSIGEILASELEAAGFEVVKDYGDLNKAFVVVYGSDPADGGWSLYTEGWGGRSAFVRYDPIGLAQMYSPWFSNMPGFNDPGYWNYENERLDRITQRIYTGNFSSEGQRNELIQQATVEAIGESVRVFLASKIDQYVVNEDVDGVINDFGAGVPTRFTPINARTDDGELVIGVKQIYQGAWNPVMGLTDSYSTHIWNPVSDPALFKHPFTGETIPVRAQWDVETGGPGQKIDVPADAVLWNPELQSWDHVEGGRATSMVTFDFEFGSWHNGQAVDIHDMLYIAYFGLEWGTAVDGEDRTVDSEFTPQAAQMVSNIVGIRPVGDSQIEMYVNYWHFDESEIASWAALWGSMMPWEIFASMEKSVLDGKMSFSRSGAASKNVSWLSLLVPNDARIIRENLEEYGREGFVPAPLRGFGLEWDYFDSRYDSTAGWIERMDHAVISNGPFYLESYAPESRTITLAAFDGPDYPFDQGHWSQFEDVDFPRITSFEVPRVAPRAEKIELHIETENASEVRYFVSNQNGIVESQTISAGSGKTVIEIPGRAVVEGTNNIKVFAVSDAVLRPDLYETSFIVSQDAMPAGDVRSGDVRKAGSADYSWAYVAAASAAAVVAAAAARAKLGN